MTNAQPEVTRLSIMADVDAFVDILPRMLTFGRLAFSLGLRFAALEFSDRRFKKLALTRAIVRLLLHVSGMV